MQHLRRSLIVVGLILAVAVSAWGECLTGDLTPEQKACCAAMHHDCGAVGMEMACCVAQPQTPERSQAPAVKPHLVEPALLNAPLVLLPEPLLRVHPVAAESFARDALELPARPTYLLLSVFLI